MHKHSERWSPFQSTELGPAELARQDVLLPSKKSFLLLTIRM